MNPDCEIEQIGVAEQQKNVKNDFTLVMSVYYEQVYTGTKGEAVPPLFSHRYGKRRNS